MKTNQNSLDIFCAEKINKLEKNASFRTLKTTHRGAEAKSRQSGKFLISFSCNDYLGLSHHPTILEKANEAARLYGAGPGPIIQSAAAPAAVELLRCDPPRGISF